MQVVIALLGKSDSVTAVAASLAALLFGTLLLLAISFVGRSRRTAREGQP
jgi:hypothetical protein